MWPAYFYMPGNPGNYWVPLVGWDKQAGKITADNECANTSIYLCALINCFLISVHRHSFSLTFDVIISEDYYYVRATIFQKLVLSNWNLIPHSSKATI